MISLDLRECLIQLLASIYDYSIKSMFPTLTKIVGFVKGTVIPIAQKNESHLKVLFKTVISAQIL